MQSIEVNDKVICIKDITNGELPYNITIGQIYEVSNCLVENHLPSTAMQSVRDTSVYINLIGKKNSYYPTELFITLKQHRENQLKLIGIE